jgi:hypothetical protein
MISARANSGKAADKGLEALVMILPALVGLIAGIIVIIRGDERSQGQRLSLRVGFILCCLLVAAYAWDRLNYLW